MPNKNGQVTFGIIIFLLFLTLIIVFYNIEATVTSLLPFILILIPLVFIIAFTNTDAALIILIFSMLLSPEFALGGITGRSIVVRLDDIILFIVFLGWFTKMAVNKELGLLRNTPLNNPIIAYIVICIVSSSIGILRGVIDIKHSFFYNLKYIEYFILFFMVCNSVKDKKQIRIFIFFILLTCFTVCIIALWNAFVYGGRATAPFEGNVGEANTLAGYLLVIIGITSGIFLNITSLNKRIIFAGLFIIIAVTLLYTLSRSGWLGLLALFIVLFILSKRNRITLLLLLLLIIIFAPVIFPRIVQRRVQATFASGQRYVIFGQKMVFDESAAARVRSLRRSLSIWAKNPILGEGVPSTEVISDVQYARVLREVGIIGFLTFLWIIITLFKVGWRSYICSETDKFEKGLSLGFLSALGGLIIMGFGSEVFIIIRIMEPFWFLTAIVVMIPEIGRMKEQGNAV